MVVFPKAPGCTLLPATAGLRNALGKPNTPLGCAYSEAGVLLWLSVVAKVWARQTWKHQLHDLTQKASALTEREHVAMKSGQTNDEVRNMHRIWEVGGCGWQVTSFQTIMDIEEHRLRGLQESLAIAQRTLADLCESCNEVKDQTLSSLQQKRRQVAGNGTSSQRGDVTNGSFCSDGAQPPDVEDRPCATCRSSCYEVRKMIEASESSSENRRWNSFCQPPFRLLEPRRWRLAPQFSDHLPSHSHLDWQHSWQATMNNSRALSWHMPICDGLLKSSFCVKQCSDIAPHQTLTKNPFPPTHDLTLSKRTHGIKSKTTTQDAPKIRFQMKHMS